MNDGMMIKTVQLAKYFIRLAGTLAVCSVAGVLADSLGFLGRAAAQNQTETVRVPSGDPLSTISRGVKMRTDPGTPPDWVVKSRKPDQESKFLPTGAAARTEPAPVMSLDRLKELEKSLDAERARHDKLGGRAAAARPVNTIALGPMPKKKAAKRACVLTCATPINSRKK